MKHTKIYPGLSVILSLLIIIGIISVSQGTVLASTDATTGLMYSISNGKATITGFMTPVGFSGTLTIPDTLGGVPVTSINSNVFSNNDKLTSVTLPSGVASIDYWAFMNCPALTAINVDTANAVYKSIDGVVYSKNEDTIIRYPSGRSGSFSIPDSVKIIEWAAFSYCALTSVTLPNTITNIETCAFIECEGLMSITIPSSVNSIGINVFGGTSALTAINVDDANTVYKSIDGLLYTEDGTLLISCPRGKTGSVTIPNGVTSIEDYAIYECGKLTSITIPSSVLNIGDRVFRYCSALTTFTVDAANPLYKSIDGLLYSKDGKQLILCPTGKSGNVAIPNGVTSINDVALAGCMNITGVTIPTSVTSIGKSAFESCLSLKSIVIPDSVTSIGDSAFRNCSALTRVTIPSSVTSIGDYTFFSCKSLTDITIPNSVTSLGDSALRECSVLTKVTIPNSVTSIGDYAFDSCKLLTDVTLPDSLTIIGNSMFRDCSALTNITIPGNVTDIENYAFYNCTNLSSANFNGNVPTMGESVFSKSASNFTVYYLSTNSGFSNPWYGYNTAPIKGVYYQTHVQDVGWQAYVVNGAASGTSGQSKRLEAIHIKLDGLAGGIEYRTHVQDIGWQGWVANNALSGTSGQAKRLEAIQIRLTGEAATLYDVYYRVHAQNTGWMDWAKNGASSGTAGYSYRLEAIEIKLVAKGGAAPGATARPFIDKNAPVVTPTPVPTIDPADPGTPAVLYKTHVQDVGWQKYISNGSESGTSGQSKRLEGIQIKLQNVAGGIEYSTHIQDIGWQGFVANDAMSGTSGQSKRLEAIRIRLTGAAAEAFDVYYCVHAQNTGWLDWAKNGESAGTAGFSYRLEAIKIVLVPKGGPAPGPTARAFVQG